MLIALSISSLKSFPAFLAGLAEALDIDVSSLTPDTLFVEVDWDSLAVISTIALIDEHFGIMIPGQEISQCKGFSDLLSLIESRMAS